MPANQLPRSLKIVAWLFFALAAVDAFMIVWALATESRISIPLWCVLALLIGRGVLRQSNGWRIIGICWLLILLGFSAAIVGAIVFFMNKTSGAVSGSFPCVWRLVVADRSSVPMWTWILGLSLLLAWMLFTLSRPSNRRFFSYNRSDMRVCAVCGYSREGLHNDAQCPECGSRQCRNNQDTTAL